MSVHKSIARIFKNLKLVYGAQFQREYLDGFEEEEVIELWAQRLEYWLDKPYAIDYALEHLPVRCPNVIEFKNLCKQAPAPVLMKLPAPQPEPTPERLAMIDRFLEKCRKSPSGPVESPSYRAWQKVQRGEPVSYYVRELYKKDFQKFAAEQKVLS